MYVTKCVSYFYVYVYPYLFEWIFFPFFDCILYEYFFLVFVLVFLFNFVFVFWGFFVFVFFFCILQGFGGFLALVKLHWETEKHIVTMALIWQITERAFIHVQKNTSLNRLKALFVPYKTVFYVAIWHTCRSK